MKSLYMHQTANVYISPKVYRMLTFVYVANDVDADEDATANTNIGDDNMYITISLA